MPPLPAPACLSSPAAPASPAQGPRAAAVLQRPGWPCGARAGRLVAGALVALAAALGPGPGGIGTAAWAQVAAADPARPSAEAAAALRPLTEAEVPALLDTLKTLVSIESGSRDTEGLRQIAGVVAERLSAAGMAVQLLPARAAEFHPQLRGAELGPMVYATRRGTGQRKVLLIAHMDTVYERGMAARQPFRLDGDRAYGLGISDDKGGVALILHTVALLARLGSADYAELGVLINGDEEIGSPGSAALLTRLGAEYDAVLSFEGGGTREDMVRLATSAIATAELTVTGRAAHAGASPESGRNALYELAHQVLKTRSLDDPARGRRLNWTVAQAGSVRNVVPAQASAAADVRARSDADLDELEAALRAAVRERLIPDTTVDLAFRRGRPAFTGNAAALVLARHAQAVFAEIGLPLEIRDRASGGGTDAAYAGLRPRGGVVESFGPRGFGAHSSEREYVLVPSLAPRLYLAVRMVQDVGSGRVRW